MYLPPALGDIAASFRSDDAPLKIMTLVEVVDVRERKILLGHKARGFGQGKWNGFGGKVDPTDRSILHAAQRELLEETGLEARRLTRRGVLFFQYPSELERRVCEVHLYLANIEDCVGTVTPSEEMTPIEWFGFDAVPLDRMWADDVHWLPQLLARIRTEAEEGVPAAGLVGGFVFRSFEAIDRVQVVEVPISLPGVRPDIDAG